MRVGILTSIETRHRYFVGALREHFDVVAVGYEQTGYTPATVLPADLTAEEIHSVNDHFAERARQESRLLGSGRGKEQKSIGNYAERDIEPGALNANSTLNFLETAGVETLVVYGTNLIKEPLLTRFGGRIINMHLGLSPYYRGTATNFYPLLNEEPEYVGATIHLIDAGIDSGPILRHARPTIVGDDRPHTIGCKAIIAGTDAMIQVLDTFTQGRAKAVPQWPVPNGKLYLRKHYHPRQVVELYRKLEQGLISRYLARIAHAPPNIRLVE